MGQRQGRAEIFSSLRRILWHWRTGYSMDHGVESHVLRMDCTGSHDLRIGFFSLIGTLSTKITAIFASLTWYPRFHLCPRNIPYKAKFAELIHFYHPSPHSSLSVVLGFISIFFATTGLTCDFVAVAAAFFAPGPPTPLVVAVLLAAGLASPFGKDVAALVFFLRLRSQPACKVWLTVIVKRIFSY